MTPEWELPRTPPASLPHLRTGRTRACLPSPASNSPAACQPGGPAPAATVPACCGGPRRAACHKSGRAPQAPVAGCAAAPQRRPQLTPRLQHRRRRARRAAHRLRARHMFAPGSRVSGRPGCRPHGLRAAAACCGTPQCACSDAARPSGRSSAPQPPLQSLLPLLALHTQQFINTEIRLPALGLCPQEGHATRS